MGKIGKLSDDATDILDGIVYQGCDKGKTAREMLPAVRYALIDEVTDKGISDDELIDYIQDSASMFGGPF